MISILFDTEEAEEKKYYELKDFSLQVSPGYTEESGIIATMSFQFMKKLDARIIAWIANKEHRMKGKIIVSDDEVQPMQYHFEGMKMESYSYGFYAGGLPSNSFSASVSKLKINGFEVH